METRKDRRRLWHLYLSSNRRPGVRHSTFESLRLGLSSQSIASGFLRFWDSLNFKKDREFVGITVLFLDEKNSLFQAEQQMEANFSGSSSTSRQNQKIDVGGSSSNRRPGVRHSTFESLRLGLSSQSIASGFLRFWDSLNFKKDREFVGITVLFLDEKNSLFQAEQQMEANFSGSSSTSR
ncbi:hypothetical protein HID58_073545 [Brassica napus]|uniref:Uncharacterized protein n=1 Tax=Brassica napus TaxID=3708 RepID=A0ABQ7Z7N1_BRANA|nr:hypothetical protein HID58_073545 [Brassica napus]